MVNSIATAENPAIDQMVSQAAQVFRVLLIESAKQRYYGKIAMEFSLQNGKIEQIKADYSRYFKV